MPFDGLLLTRAALPLARAAAALDISGIDPMVLAAHKRAECARHPGGFIFRHRSQLALLTSLLALAGVIDFLLSPDIYATLDPTWRMNLTLAGFWLILPLLLLETIPVRGPASWKETPHLARYFSSAAVPMPAAVVDLATALQRELGEQTHTCVFIVGELRQETVLLDPYLIIKDRATGEQMVLAIWNDQTILHIAH